MLQVSARDSQSLQETASLVPLQHERNPKTHCLPLQPVDQICKHKQTCGQPGEKLLTSDLKRSTFW